MSKHTDHTGWMAIGTAQELTSITSSGNYYLTGDVTLTENEAWKPADGVVLCLNGHSITSERSVNSIINKVFVRMFLRFRIMRYGTGYAIPHFLSRE